MEQKVARIQEIYRRGLQDKLPPEKRQIADELIRRGVVKIEQQEEQQIQEPMQEEAPQTEPRKRGEYYTGEPSSGLGEAKALGVGAVKGATFGFSDELKALGKKGGQAIEKKIYGDTLEPELPFREQAQVYKEREKEVQEQYPVQSTIGEIGGAVASPIGGLVAKGVGSAIKGTKALSQIGRVGATGVGEGAIIGAGYGENLGDIKEGALVGGLLGTGLGTVAKGAGLAMKTLKPLIGRAAPKRAEASKLIKTLKREGVTPEEARAGLQKMQDEGVALIDVVDPRSSLISSIPERAFEKKTIDTIDNYVNQLNSAGNKAKSEVLDLVSKKKITATEGAELVGQNAQEVIKRQKQMRTANAKPLYEKAKTGFIPENDPILNVPVVKEAIEQARKESAKFGDDAIGGLKRQAVAEDYTIGHRPTETGAIGSDITMKGELMPDDVYTHPHYYADMSNKTNKESFEAIKRIRNKPEAEVTIYRASPKDEFNRGDWVTLSKDYAKLHAEGKPNMKVHSFKVKAKDIQFAGDDINEFGYFPEKITKTDLPDNSIAVLHQAKDYLYRKSKDFTDLESARYGQVYGELSNKLKKNPDYKKATDIWAGETEGIEQLYKQKGIGNLAKKYEKGDLDGIQSSFRNVFKKSITDEQIARLKNSLPPEQFNAIVRKDLDTLIDEGGDTGSNLTNSLFGKGDAERSLKNKRLDLVFNPTQKRGLRKTVELLDSAKERTAETGKLKYRTGTQQLQYIPGGRFAFANTALQAGKMLKDSPAQREAFVNYLFTQQGQELLEQIAKSNKRDAQNLIMQSIPAILTQTQGEE